MIRLSRESYQLANPAPLHEALENKQIIERLLQNMFSSETPSDVVIINGISVLLTILRERWVGIIWNDIGWVGTIWVCHQKWVWHYLEVDNMRDIVSVKVGLCWWALFRV